jgi:hypothetical protein
VAKGPSSEVILAQASQQISRFFWNPTVYYNLQKLSSVSNSKLIESGKNFHTLFV